MTAIVKLRACPDCKLPAVLDLETLDVMLSEAMELALALGAPRAEVDRFRMARFMVPVLRARVTAADASSCLRG